MYPHSDPRLSFLLKYPPLDLAGDRSIGNGNSLPISTTYLATSIPYTGPEFQSYSANNTPFNHW